MADSPILRPFSTLLTDPVRNFKFVVSFNPTNTDSAQGWKTTTDTWGKMGFVSVSGLSIATEAIAYREGGYNTNFHQIPGQSSFTPITFSKGVLLGQNANVLWMKRLFSTLTGNAQSGIGADFRCDIDIQVLSHPNPKATKTSAGAAATTPGEQHASIHFHIYNAWITNLSYSNLDAGANTLMVEEMQIVHEGFDVAYATDYATTAADPSQASGMNYTPLA
jgi:phage tail-like protein